MFYISFQGNKPDFHNAMPGDQSKEFYEKFLQMLKDAYVSDKIKGSYQYYLYLMSALVSIQFFSTHAQMALMSMGLMYLSVGTWSQP